MIAYDDLNGLPTYVVNSLNMKEKFDLERINQCFHEIGIKTELVDKLNISILKKIKQLVDSKSEKFTTNMIKMFIILELESCGLDKYSDLYQLYEEKKRTKFKLSDKFIDKYRWKQPIWGPLGYVVYKRTYSRKIYEEDRTEEFFETIQRCVEGCFSIQKSHCFRLGLPWDEERARISAEIMYDKMWNFKFLPPGRGLWMMGTDFVDKHGSMCLNNCGFVSTNNIKTKLELPFVWTMDALMLGVGVGFDVNGANELIIKQPIFTDAEYIIPDSRKGWTQAVGNVVRGYFSGGEIPKFNFNKIRRKGLPIKGFGGISSGPGPLINLIEEIQDLLSKKIGEKICSTDIVDIMNFIGKCVVAGNVRRSAEIALGDIDDDDFINLKKDKEKLRTHRWASNNSVVVRKGMDYSKVIDSISKNGEPGLVWLENARDFSRMGSPPDFKDKKAMGVNPCVEQTLESYELCCLVETFPSRHDNYDEYKNTLKYAYLYAKSVTLVNTHWDITNAVMLKNRRIGVSQSGIIDAFVKHGRYGMMQWCNKGYDYLRNLDEIYSNWLCVPKSIKITSVKPSGTVSLLPGVSPGIHYPHSEYYIRRIRLMENSKLIDVLKNAGYHIEKDICSKNTSIVSCPIKEKYFERSKRDVSIWEQFVNASSYQSEWADNQVSITITFKEEEKKDIYYCLHSFEDKLKGVSLLPLDDHKYPQPPYEEITEEQYKEMLSKIKLCDFNKYCVEGEGTNFCDSDNGKCDIILKN